MNTYTVRRSKLSLWIGYLLAEITLISIVIGMLIIWKDEPSYLDWSIAIISWVTVALFFHFLLFLGTFYKVQINDEKIEYHAFLRKKRIFNFSDILEVKQSTGLDIKIVGHNNKRLFYVKQSDRHIDRFMADVYAHIDSKK